MEDHPGGRPIWPDPQALARDWITIWQSEMAALGTDREAHEHLAVLIAAWAGAAQAAAAWLPGPIPAVPRDEPSARAAAPAGSAPPGAAPDAAELLRDPADALRRLAERVAELERRAAEPAGGNAAA